MCRLMLVVMLFLLPWSVAATEGRGAPGPDRIAANSGDATSTALRPPGAHEALLRTLGGTPDRLAEPPAAKASLMRRAPSTVGTRRLLRLAPADPEGCIPICERFPFYPTAPPRR